MKYYCARFSRPGPDAEGGHRAASYGSRDDILGLADMQDLVDLNTLAESRPMVCFAWQWSSPAKGTMAAAG
jgi:hypothetical protein